MKINIDLGMLQMVLVIFKLAGVIAWPWYLVMIPSIVASSIIFIGFIYVMWGMR